MTGDYSPQFFADIMGESMRSAEIIVPMFNEIVKPRSVVDVGCGKGWFLRTFIELGVDDVLGLDGAPAEDLVIPAEKYRQVDLRQPPAIDRGFDLVVSLEVAEHLPESDAAGFVAFLCSLGDIVLFSAAIPMQGGEGHLNERWLDYWLGLFAHHEYRASGWPRLDLWENSGVAPYYRQNIVLLARAEYLLGNDDLRFYVDGAPAGSLRRVVHPEMYAQKLGVTFE